MERRDQPGSTGDRGKQGSSMDSSIKLAQAEMLLNVAQTVAAYETLDGMLTSLVEMIVEKLDADRATIFLNDEETGELYSRVAHGNLQREIRILNNTGVAGDVFTTGRGAIVPDAYADERFNRSVDQKPAMLQKPFFAPPSGPSRARLSVWRRPSTRRTGRLRRRT